MKYRKDNKRSAGEANRQDSARSGRAMLEIPRATAMVLMAVLVIVAFILGTRAYKLSPLFARETVDFSSLNNLYDTLLKNYDGTVDKTKLLDGAKHGMVDALGDQHTMYFNAEEAASFSNDLNGTFEGIGAEIGKTAGVITIISVLNDSPAKAAGLQSGDGVLAVNGEETAGMSAGQAVLKIRGEKGTTVKLSILRGDTTQEVSVTRDVISTPSVTTELLKDGRVGYMRVSRFGDDTAELARSEALKFKNQGVSSVILDVRGNSGGYVTAAQELAGLWLRQKTVATERKGGTIRSTFTTGNDAPLEGIKTIVLVDGGSASASEIVAAALRDHGAATLLGEKTYGKGSMQVVEKLANGGELKVTVAKWYTPKGANVDKKGIEPDTTVTMTEEDYQAQRDPQKDAALATL